MDPISITALRRVECPIMFQRWSHISFLHWKYPADAIQRLLPHGLKVDLHDSHAWIGLTPFVVEKLRPPFLPPLPWISRFPETNVRTYVVAPDGSRGVWFFSLEAARGLAVAAARVLYGLPYRWADMTVAFEGKGITYRSRRRASRGLAATDIVLNVGSQTEPAAREIFLTARFRLYSVRGGRVWFADVEHEPWPLWEARICRLEESLLASLSFDRPGSEPLVHYSPGVETRISRPALLD
jgi:uncharacterized protein